MNNNKKMPRLQKSLMLTDIGYRNLKKAIAACTLTNFSMMIPFGVVIIIIMELIKPMTGQEISWQRMWIYFAFGLFGAVLIFLCNRFDYKKTYVNSYMESENTRTSIAEHLRKLPMSVFNSKDLSDLTTNMMGDVATTEHVLSHIIPQIFANAISIIVICTMLAFLDWRMALAMFITVPLAFLCIVLCYKIRYKISESHIKSKLKASGQVQEYIEGIKVIKACNLGGEKFSALEKALCTMRNLAIKLELGTGVFVTGAQVILQAGIGLTILAGATLLSSGQIELVPMLMFILMVTRIYGPILIELTLLPELLYHQIAVKRMHELMEIEPMVGDTQKEINDYSINFEHVDFHYNKGDDETIKDMTVSIPSGTITALVGPSGSGKSTVTRLIARFWDVNAGHITIGGTDIKTLDPEHLMSYMSFVFQDVVLFNDTIYNNIRIGKMDARREEVIAAAKTACCDEFIEKLPSGYDTVLGENGSTLSGGERQRLSIARALLKDAPIILLDEATASLDPENEALIQQAISALIDGKTVIVIAHRLKTVADADAIIVLENGRVAEQGKHLELIKKDGLYAKLWNVQQQSLGWSV